MEQKQKLVVEELFEKYHAIGTDVELLKDKIKTIEQLSYLLEEVNQLSAAEIGAQQRAMLEINCKSFLFLKMQETKVQENIDFAVSMMMDVFAKYNKNPDLYKENKLLDSCRFLQAISLLFDCYLTCYTSENQIPKKVLNDLELTYNTLVSFKERSSDVEFRFKANLKLINSFLFYDTEREINRVLPNGLRFPDIKQALLFATDSIDCVSKEKKSACEFLKYLEELLKLMNSFSSKYQYKAQEISQKEHRSGKVKKLSLTKVQNASHMPIDHNKILISTCVDFYHSDRLLSFDKFMQLWVSTRNTTDSSLIELREVVFNFLVGHFCVIFLPLINKVLGLPDYREKLQQLSKNSGDLHDFLYDVEQYSFWRDQLGKNVIAVVVTLHTIIRIKCSLLDPELDKIRTFGYSDFHYNKTDPKTYLVSKNNYELVSRVVQMLKDIDCEKQQDFEKYCNEIEQEERRREEYKKYMKEYLQRVRRLKNASASGAATPINAINDADQEKTNNVEPISVGSAAFVTKNDLGDFYENQVKIIDDAINTYKQYIEKTVLSGATVLGYLQSIDAVIKEYEALLALTKIELIFLRRLKGKSKKSFFENKIISHKRQLDAAVKNRDSAMTEVKKYYLVSDRDGNTDFRDELYIYLGIHAPEFLSENNSSAVSSQEELVSQEEALLSQIFPRQASPTVSVLPSFMLKKMKRRLPLYENVLAVFFLFKESLCLVDSSVFDALNGECPLVYNLAIKDISLLDAKTTIEKSFPEVSCKLIEAVTDHNSAILRVFFKGDRRFIKITPYISPKCRVISVNAFEYYQSTQELVYLSQSMDDFEEKRIALFSDQNLEQCLKSDIELMFRVLCNAAKHKFSIDDKLDVAIKDVAEWFKEKLSIDEKIKMGVMLRKLFFEGYASQALQLILKRPHLSYLLFGVSVLGQSHALMLQRLCQEMDAQYKKGLAEILDNDKVFRALPAPQPLFFATLLLPSFLERLRVHLVMMPSFVEAFKVVAEMVLEKNADFISNKRDFPMMKAKISNVWLALYKYYFYKTGFMAHESSSQQLSYQDFCDGDELWNAAKMFNFSLSVDLVPTKPGFFPSPPALFIPIVPPQIEEHRHPAPGR